MLIFDPTSVVPVSVVPHCSQIQSIVGLFRKAWKRVEECVEETIRECEGVEEREEMERVGEKVVQKRVGSGDLLGDVFGFQRTM